MTGPAGISPAPPAGTPLVLRGREVGRGPDGALRGVVMAIVNRTTDSFYAPARLSDDGAALEAAHRAWSDGAQILDVGGVRAGVGPEVGEAEEIDRVVPFVAQVREQVPDLLVSVDTWRSGVARAAVAAGVDLVNDTWAGHDAELVRVAGAAGVGVVCSHTGGALPRTDPFRVEYPPAGDPAGPGVQPDGDPRDGVLDDVVHTLRAAAARAVDCGVPPASVLVDPTHDFGKNTWHSLHLLRRTEALAGLGHPLLMALSRKDFVGETLDLPPAERLAGTLAATAVAAWLGAGVFRAHDVAATRRALDLVAALRDEAPPRLARRGMG